VFHGCERMLFYERPDSFGEAMLFPLCMNLNIRNKGIKPNFRVIIMEMVKSPKGFESSHNGKSFVMCWVFL
jgi:hypothetical protein